MLFPGIPPPVSDANRRKAAGPAKASPWSESEPAGLSLSLGLVVLADIYLLNLAQGAAPERLLLATTKLVLAAVALGALAMTLADRRVSLLSRGLLLRDSLSLTSAAIAFGVGILELGFVHNHTGAFAIRLVALGFRPPSGGGHSWGFEACATIAVTTLAARFAASKVQRQILGRAKTLVSDPCPDGMRGAHSAWEGAATRAVFATTLSCALLAALMHGWMGGGPLSPLALLSSMAVLAGLSPATIALAAPLARAAALRRARGAHVVVNDASALEALASADVAWFERIDLVTPEAQEIFEALRARRILPTSPALTPLCTLCPSAHALAISNLQLVGARVVVVGDDASPAVAAEQADVSVALAAPGHGSPRASIVVCDGHLEALPSLVDRGRTLRAVLRQNVVLGSVYNALLLPVAILGYLSPVRAAAFTLLETLIALANVSRLLWPARRGACRAIARHVKISTP